MPLIRKILFFPFCLLVIVIFERLMPNDLAKSFMYILFSAPSIGGDVRRIFNESLYKPQIIFFDDRGCIIVAN